MGQDVATTEGASVQSSSAASAERTGAVETFARIRLLVILYLVATAATLVFVALERDDRTLVDSDVWTHAIIVFGFALLLVGVARRAARGAPRAHLRLRIISVVIPLVSVVLVVVPGLFPTWMKIEQAVYAVLLLAVAVLANCAGVRSAYGGA